MHGARRRLRVRRPGRLIGRGAVVPAAGRPLRSESAVCPAAWRRPAARRARTQTNVRGQVSRWKTLARHIEGSPASWTTRHAVCYDTGQCRGRRGFRIAGLRVSGVCIPRRRPPADMPVDVVEWQAGTPHGRACGAHGSRNGAPPSLFLIRSPETVYG